MSIDYSVFRPAANLPSAGQSHPGQKSSQQRQHLHPWQQIQVYVFHQIRTTRSVNKRISGFCHFQVNLIEHQQSILEELFLKSLFSFSLFKTFFFFLPFIFKQFFYWSLLFHFVLILRKLFYNNISDNNKNNNNNQIIIMIISTQCKCPLTHF